jgi:hypothetical protein
MTKTVANNNYQPANTTFYANSQTVLAGGDVILKTENLGQGAPGGIVSVEGWSYQLSVSNGASPQNVNVTLYGLDYGGNAISEVVALTPSTSANSLLYYSKLLRAHVGTIGINAIGVIIGHTEMGISDPFYQPTGILIQQWALQVINPTTSTDDISFDIEITNYPIKNLASNPSTITDTFPASGVSTTSVWTPLPYYQSGIDATDFFLTYSTGSKVDLNAGALLYFSSDVVMYALRINVNGNNGATSLSVSFTEQGTK